MNCDFESGFEGYFNDPTADFEWKLYRASTQKVTPTKPSGDHTTGTGIFAYIDSVYPFNLGDKARLLSTLQDPVESGCYSFYYYMFGPDIDSLNIYLEEYAILDETALTSKQLVWTKSKSQAKKWFAGRTTISTKSYWRISIEAVHGKSWRGHIAIGK